MNMKCCVALVALSGVLTARAAAPAVTSVTIADGGEMTFDVASAANTSGASGSPHFFFLEGSGTIRLKNAGSSCAVKPCIFATNGTVTIVAEGCTTVALRGGLLCGDRGGLKVTGASEVLFGGQVGSVNIPFMASSVELDAGATFCFDDRVTFYTPPPAFATFGTGFRPTIGATDVLAAFRDEDGVYAVTNGTGLTILSYNPFSEPTAIRLEGKRDLYVYAVYSPCDKSIGWEYPAGSGTYLTNYYSWYGDKVVIDEDIELGAGSWMTVGLRSETFKGTISGAGQLTFSGSSSGVGKLGTTTFDGPVLTTGRITVGTSSAGRPKKIVFNNVAFTNGTARLDFNNSVYATNDIVAFTATKAGGVPFVPTFASVKFAVDNGSVRDDGGASRDCSHIEIAPGLTVAINKIELGANLTTGGGVVTGGGTVKLGGIAAPEAALYAVAGTAVEKDPSVTGSYRTGTGPDGSTKYWGLADDTVDLTDTETYPADSTVKISGDVTVVPSSEASAGIEMTAGNVRLMPPGAEWRTAAAYWYDFSDLRTFQQVVAKDPTSLNGCTGASVTLLPPEELGPKSIKVGKVEFPALESVADRRGEGFGKPLENPRMYQNLKKYGTNEWWNGVYMYAVTNDASGRCYLSSGTETGNAGRRLEFSPAVSNPKMITLVFGSQNGGGAGLFASTLSRESGWPNGSAFGRTKGVGNPIMTNACFKVWVDGELVDPTMTAFSGGWQVITLMPTNIPGGTFSLPGIGYSQAYTGDGVDGGGQNYGEIVIYSSASNPTDDERVAIERTLAQKWGIAYNGPASALAVQVTGAGDVTVEDSVSVDGGFTGALTLMDTDIAVDFSDGASAANVTVKGSGVVKSATRDGIPRFDASFTGAIELGPQALTLTVPADADPETPVLDLRPATVRFLEPPTLTVTYPSGQPQPGLYRLVSAGGGLDSPTWSYDLPKGAKVKSVTATDILMKVAGGLLLLLR